MGFIALSMQLRMTLKGSTHFTWTRLQAARNFAQNITPVDTKRNWSNDHQQLSNYHCYCILRHHHNHQHSSNNIHHQRHHHTHHHPHKILSCNTLSTMSPANSHILSTSGVSILPVWTLPAHYSLDDSTIRLFSNKSQDRRTTTDKTKGISSVNTTKEKSNIEVELINTTTQDDEKNLSLVKRFKLMYQRYWYVLLPVHIVTSTVWYGSFFIAAKSGVDIVPILEAVGASESMLDHVRGSDAGYYAIAYAMYKLATPARYTVTLGGTTISISYLKDWGYIKPVPSKEKLKEMYEGKKEELIEKREEVLGKYQEKKDEMRDKLQERKEEMRDKLQERKEEIIEKYQDKKEEMVDKYTERKEELKEKYEEKKGDIKDILKSRTKK